MPEMQSPGSKKPELDSSLSKILFNYVLPFFNPNYIIKDKKIKTKKSDISLLERIILSKIDKEKVKVNKKLNNFENILNKNNKKINNKNFDEFENIDVNNFNGNIIEKIKSNGNMDYSLELVKENAEQKPYSVSVTYEENSEEERLDITVKPNNYSLNKINNQLNKEPLKNYSNNNDSIKNKKINEKDTYSISITRKKQNKTNYSVKIKYEDNYEQERLLINYKEDSLRYKKKRENSLQDFSERVPGKFVNVFPESMLGGILGFTYLGENFMGKREDMVSNQMVDVHESIHTDNEYETRLLTSWILSKERMKYIR